MSLTLERLIDKHALSLIIEPPSRGKWKMWTVAVEPPHGVDWCGVCRSESTLEKAMASVRSGVLEWESNKAVHKSQRRWTRDTLIDAGVEYHRRYGEMPTILAFRPDKAVAQGRHEIADRHHECGMPSWNSLRTHFGGVAAYFAALSERLGMAA